jgi:type IV pilus biogenesis protein CpaD/CtpE
MSTNYPLFAGVMVSMLGLCGCASAPPDETSAIAAAQKPGARWTVATEEEVAAALDKQLYDAARGLVKLKKDGELMFCKRYREVGSNIRTLKCITVPELRTRVENMTNYRDDMRNKAGKCTLGRAGGPPCGGGD